MINYYNAFISYKHADLDNKVAAEIVRGLEHYHIPKKIQKSTGIKKIDRIFRDKDELPITNDLNDTISEALKNADYLIVICSTNTCKSTWVEKEIETFLQNHTMNQVLTVLADGEPYDVIPKMLLTGKRNVVDENGETKTIEVPLEPLSCDFRLPLKKARAEELPRLAAALIGCSYDELMNRHRQYKMRRMTAIFAGAMALTIGFSGYMLYSRTLIHQNYIESLRSQSRFLATQSTTVFSDANRIDAIHLALAALPTEENSEMPVTPEAVKAITKASYAYVSLSGSSISANWNYTMPNIVRSFKISRDGTKLAAIDDACCITVWDTASHKQILSLNFDDYDVTYEFFNSDKISIYSDKAFYFYDLNSGELLWKKDLQDSYGPSVFKYTDNSLLIAFKNGELMECSIDDGSEISTSTFLENRDILEYASSLTLSDDKTKLAFSMSVPKEEKSDDVFKNNNYYLCVYDMETKELKSELIGDCSLTSITFDGNNNIFFACHTGSFGDGSTRYNYYTFTTDDFSEIYCYSSEDLTQKWTQEFVCDDVEYDSSFLPLANGTILYHAGNAGSIYDCETGEVIENHHLTDSIIDASDNDGDGVPLYVVRSGATVMPTTLGSGSKGVASIDRFTDKLDEVHVNGAYYTHQTYSHDIISYGVNVCDEDWTKFTNCEATDSPSSSHYLDDDVLALLYDNGDGTDLAILDPNDKTYKTTITLSDTVAPYRFKILGTYNKVLYVVYNEYISGNTADYLKLVSYNLVTKETEEKELTDNYTPMDICCGLVDNKIAYFLTEDYKSCGIYLLDLDTGKEEVIPIEGLELTYCKSLQFFDNSHLAYFIGDTDDKNYIIDLENKKSFEIALPEDWSGTTSIAVTSKGDKIAFSNDEVIIVKNIEGELLGEIDCEHVPPLGMTFYDDPNQGETLLVAYSNGSLARYMSNDCTYIATSDLSTYANDSSEATFKFDQENGCLYVTMDKLVDIIDLNSWYETTVIEACLGHHIPTDTFITSSYSDSKERYIGYFKHYTTEDLINKAQNIIQDTEMPANKKAMYGIG